VRLGLRSWFDISYQGSNEATLNLELKGRTHDDGQRRTETARRRRRSRSERKASGVGGSSI